LLLPDGRLLAEADDKTPLGKVLGFLSEVDGDDDGRRKEKCDKERDVECKREERKTKNPKGVKVAGKCECEPPKAVMLKSFVEEDYEPGETDVQRYAEWLGMDLEKDADLLWVAREGLKAPLPQDWKPCKTNNGEIFYYNTETCKSFWDHPCDEHYRRLLKEVRERQNALRMSVREAMSEPGSSEQIPPAVASAGNSSRERPKLTLREAAAAESWPSSSSPSSDPSCSSSLASPLHAEAPRLRTPKVLPPLDLRLLRETLHEPVAIS
jgi:centrosomal protein CEP164